MRFGFLKEKDWTLREIIKFYRPLFSLLEDVS